MVNLLVLKLWPMSMLNYSPGYSLIFKKGKKHTHMQKKKKTPQNQKNPPPPKNFTVKLSKHGNTLLRDIVVPPPSEIFQTRKGLEQADLTLKLALLSAGGYTL